MSHSTPRARRPSLLRLTARTSGLVIRPALCSYSDSGRPKPWRWSRWLPQDSSGTTSTFSDAKLPAAQLAQARLGRRFALAAQVLEHPGSAVVGAGLQERSSNGCRRVDVVRQDGQLVRAARPLNRGAERATVRRDHRGVLPGHPEPGERQRDRRDVRHDLDAVTAQAVGKVRPDAKVARVTRGQHHHLTGFGRGVDPGDDVVEAAGDGESLSRSPGEQVQVAPAADQQIGLLNTPHYGRRETGRTVVADADDEHTSATAATVTVRRSR